MLQDKTGKTLIVALGDRFQTERALLSLKDSELHILDLAPDISSVDDMAKQFDTVQNVIKGDYDRKRDLVNNIESLSRSLKVLNFECAIISQSLQQLQMEFCGKRPLKRINNYYGVVRLLYLAGIKDIRFFESGSYLPINPERLLDDYIEKHKGRRAFVIGNGPSLNKIDMSRLKGEITFGSNRGYLGLEKWGFNFTYWSVGDRLQVEEHMKEWEVNMPDECVKFIPFEYYPLFHMKNLCPINFKYNFPDFPSFSDSPQELYIGHSILYTLLQIAVIMGCNPIYMVGADHNYPLKAGTRFKNRIKKILKKSRYGKALQKTLGLDLQETWTPADMKTSTHFDDRYTGEDKGRRFIVPRPELAEEAFAHAASWTKQHGIQLFNATPGTKLEVVKKIDFDSLDF